MLITSNYPNVSLNTANPATEMARRDNQRRDLFEPVQEAAKTSAEKPVVSDDKRQQQLQPGQTPQRNEPADTETNTAVRGREQDAAQDQQGRSDDEQQRQQAAEQKEQQALRELRARDREVRAHEQAHAAVGGQYASAPSYTYQRGPDGNQYAVGGEVQIDLSEIPDNPQATAQKMQQVRAAALAPAEPSAADRRIAAEASRRMLAARAEMAREAIARSDEPATPRRVKANRAAEEQIRVSTAGTAANSDTETLQRRSQVIAGFYQQATRPSLSSLLQQV
ncbi:putative metalloprotease CJM1_0395 family protein [Alkalimonas sp. NCh-2]|uniref:putative metalloprotease CJM1_0395 family protein n=1 Tax=Alkalimonas sp. NCh-2 TaxID=3144846 RepID=UPI0031F7181A